MIVLICGIGFITAVACIAVAVRARQERNEESQEFVGVINSAPIYGGDPIYEHNGLWYFWDETWANYYGPYLTEKIARDNLSEYCESMELGIAHDSRDQE